MSYLVSLIGTMAKVAGYALLLVLLFVYPGLLWLALLPAVAVIPFLPALLRELWRKPPTHPGHGHAAE